MKTIIFAHHVSKIGGASWCLFEILRELDRSKFNPIVILVLDGPLASRIRKLGIRVIINRYITVFPVYSRNQFVGFLQLIRLLASFPQGHKNFFSLCKELKPDIVYLTSSAQLLLAYSAKKAGVPKIFLHNREHWEPVGILRIKSFIRNYQIKNYIDKVFSITQCGADSIHFPSKSSIIRDWPSFDDESDYNIRLHLDIDPLAPIVLLTGGFQSIKGSRDVLEAFSLMQMRDSVFVLIVGCEKALTSKWKIILKNLIGYNSYSDTMIHLAAESDHIFLLPPTLKMKAYIQACDVLVAPFNMPHAAKASLEAQYLNKSTVLYESAEAREYTQNGTSGLIVPAGDIKALANALDTLTASRSKRLFLGKMGRLNVLSNFSKDTNLSKLYNAFSSS